MYGEKACTSRETGCGEQRSQVEACSKYILFRIICTLFEVQKFKRRNFTIFLLFSRDMELDSSPSNERRAEGDEEKGSEISPTICNNCVFILRNGFTLHVSGDNLTHHHEYVFCIWPQVCRLT